MKLCLVSLYATACLASTLFPRQDGQTKTVRIPIEKIQQAASVAGKHRRADVGKTIMQRLDNMDFLFYTNVSVGTPPQPVRLHIDTGSSDIWVEDPKSKMCANNACASGGAYDNTTSSTYKYLNNNFSIQYIDSQYAAGSFGLDTLSIGGVNITGVQFGVGEDSTSDEGILGIGFESKQAGAGRGEPTYPGLISNMVTQGLINSRAYSIWLNDLDATEGEILFGGIDTAKYIAPLSTIPFLKAAGNPNATEFIINLTGLEVVNGDGGAKVMLDNSTSTGRPSALDTGASFTYLPEGIANQLNEMVGAKLIPEYKGPAVNCTARSIPGTIDFNFSGVVIKVRIRDFIIDATMEDNSDNAIACYFGILGVKENVILTLGDTFLRSTYVVFDLDNEAVSMAPTVFNTTQSNVIEIGAGTSAVPSATSVSPSVMTMAAVTSSTGGVVTTGSVSPTSTSTSTSTNYGSTASRFSILSGSFSGIILTICISSLSLVLLL